MIISYQWLSKYLPEALPEAELSSILTSIGLEVEAMENVEEIKGSLEGLLIGSVLTCSQHPNADKLKVTTVSVGDERILNIVCGASNVAAGQKVVVATVGTTVHPVNGASFLIKKAKIRGEESEGMICAEDEIGLGNSHEGIIVLPEDAPVGMAAADYFKIAASDIAIHIGLTPNRSDAMSHIGVARDVCAYLSHHKGKQYEVVMPDLSSFDRFEKHTQRAAIVINIKDDAKDACKRYAGISIEGVQIAESPDWMKRYLKAIGVRPINNVVDITNFVLHEYGQPLHAFDADKISGKSINIGFLPEGSAFITLDEKERKLYAEDLMICDAEKGLCIAGVFGGNNSGVAYETTNIFLESAYFHPAYIRKTSLRHGLRTDAATHFEKGVDINNIVPALKRATAMILELAGGALASDIQDIYPHPVQPVTVAATYAYIQKLSGKHYTAETIKGILSALNFVIEKEDALGITVKVPSNKTDVLYAADLVEEILRIDGLDNITAPGRINIPLTKPMYTDRSVREKIAGCLCGMGFQEIMTNSITNSQYYPGNEQLVRMLNSLSSELDILRPSMLESGLEVINYNANRKNQDLMLFEFGNIYTTEGIGKYEEETQLAMWITGNTSPAQWAQKAGTADLFYVKGIINTLLKISGIEKAIVTYQQDDTIVWKWKNEILCSVAPVPSQKLKHFDIRQDVFFANIHWMLWLKASSAHQVKYDEVPKFPAMQRDLALVLDKGITYEDIQKVTAQLKIESLKDYTLFDVFESEKLGTDKKSYAMNYTFQVKDRTLTDSEIEQYIQTLIQAYQNKLNAQIRS